MNRLVCLLLSSLSVSAAAQTLPLPGAGLESAFAAALAAATPRPRRPEPVRASTPVAKCWRRAADVSIDYTAMPLAVCVDGVFLDIPYDRNGGLMIGGGTTEIEGGVVRSARLTANGTAAHPGTPGDSSFPAFRKPLAGDALIFGDRDAAGYSVSAVVYEGDYDIGDSSRVTLLLRVDAAGRVIPGSVRLRAEIVCAPARCMGAEPDREVAFKESSVQPVP